MNLLSRMQRTEWAGIAVTLQIRIWVVLGWNLGQDSGHPEALRNPLTSSRSSTIRHAPIILLFDATAL
jgi:hypothetical protein